jgi:hypothetical protein
LIVVIHNRDSLIKPKTAMKHTDDLFEGFQMDILVAADAAPLPAPSPLMQKAIDKTKARIALAAERAAARKGTL